MSKRIYTVFFLFSPALLFAQVVSNGGRFSVDFDRGCAPLEINVTELDGFGNITRQYFYEEGATETTSKTYTYNTPGTYQIVQVIGIDVIPKTDTLVINVIDPTDTHFSVEKCNSNGISITSEEEVYDFIRIYFTPTDSATLAFGEQASFIYPSSSNQTFQSKGFYNGGKENCTVFSHDVEPLTTLSTPVISSSEVRETCQDHFVLVLEVESFDPEIVYQIEINQGIPSIAFQGKFDDTMVIVDGISYNRDESEYCIKVNAVDNCTSVIEEGTSFCQTISTLSSSPFEELYSSYTTNGVFINMDSVLSGNLLVYRKIGENGAFELRNTVQNAFIDPLRTQSRRYFYRIDYLDTCNQVLFSFETNPPLLSSTTTDENIHQISFTESINMLQGSRSVEYTIGNEVMDQEPITSNSFELRLNAQNGTRQFLTANETYSSGIELLSNELTYKYIPIIYVPAAFTPNGDGLNDTLELFGLPTETATTNIYTKWGQLIYTSNEPIPGWDGLINGSLAPEGAYLYEVIFQNSDGEKVIQKGTFALIKK